MRIDVQVDQGDSTKLSLTYTFTAPSDQDVYLFNGIRFHDEPASVVSRAKAFTSIEGDLVVVSQVIPEVPEGMEVNVFHVPMATRLAAGTHYRNTVECPIPVTTRGYYLRRDRPLEALGARRPSRGALSIRKIRVHLGFVPARSDIASRETLVNAAQWFRPGPTDVVLKYYREVRSDVVVLPAPVPAVIE